MAQDLLWLLRGRQGDHRSELNCEWIAAEAPDAPAAELDLLDPNTGAWSVQMDARVAGSLDAARLRAALAAALGCDDDPLTVVDCPDDDALAATRAGLQHAPARADERPPLRACLAHHGDGDVLMLSLNHAACDGFGALAVLQAIARAYAGEPDPPLDFLATRDLPVRPAAVFTSIPERMYKKVVERVRDTRDRPARLAEDEPVDDVGCGIHCVALSAEDTRSVVGTEHGRTNTDVLMAALHLAISEWNDQHDGGSGRQRRRARARRPATAGMERRPGRQLLRRGPRLDDALRTRQPRLDA